MVHTKPLYSNAKLIAFWRNTCILHDTALEFCQATVSSIKCIVHMFTKANPRSRYRRLSDKYRHGGPGSVFIRVYFLQTSFSERKNKKQKKKKKTQKKNKTKKT